MKKDFKKYTLSLAVGTALLATTVMSASAAYVYEFETAGGGIVAIDAISGTESAADYYDYFSLSGHPDFGTVESSAFFWLYEETDTGILSMNVIFNDADGDSAEGGGTARFDVTGLPAGWSWALSDDSHETGFAWGWNGAYTDGGVMSGFEDSTWEVDWNLIAATGVEEWAFISGNSNDVNPFVLGDGDTLTVRATSDPVPEPATMLLFGTGLAAMTGLRRRKK